MIRVSVNKARKGLSADGWFRMRRVGFEAIPDLRASPSVSLAEALMSGFALFSRKDPSLLAFDDRRRDPNDNFRSIFGIERVPCDTQLREILDPVDPELLDPLFGDVFRRLQRGKGLEALVSIDGHDLLSLDGTGYDSSSKIHCASCWEKRHRGGGVTYSHQVLGATLVHPDLKVVIPLAPEPIIPQDGSTQNDCERNATRRWRKRFRQEHPQWPVIIVEEALSSNAPHLDDLREAHVHDIMGVKPGDHVFLFQHLREADEAGRTQTVTQVERDTGVRHHFRCHHRVPLNESHPDHLVNVLEYGELTPAKIVKGVQQPAQLQYFSWITDFELTPDNVDLVLRGGRSRGKIENETFNTLKNQGDHWEHNYGHGEQHLSVVLLLLLLLAFLVDQTQQHCCPLFQAAWQKRGRHKRSLWEDLRNLFQSFVFASMPALYEALINGIVRQPPVLQNSS